MLLSRSRKCTQNGNSHEGIGRTCEDQRRGAVTRRLLRSEFKPDQLLVAHAELMDLSGDARFAADLVP
jgi:hypothetical protein